jgi:hypothetical protein
MGSVLAKVWAWLAVILPAIFGVLLLVSPQTGTQMNSPEVLAELVGIRQLVYSLVLLVAILAFPGRVVALLLAGRGLTDLSDGLASIIATGGLGGPTLFPLVTAVISFAAAYYLFRRAP